MVRWVVLYIVVVLMFGPIFPMYSFWRTVDFA